MRQDGMFHLIAFGLIIICIWLLYDKWYKAAIYLILVTVIYIVVGSDLNTTVRRSSTHGNTIHGWYSKYNSEEKAWATAWFYLFPVGAILTPVFLMAKFGKGENKKE